MSKIVENILDFYKNIENQPNHRYRSWEHCYKYFSQDKQNIDNETACLHLSFYLASWGMYRGSSFLLQYDYLVHREAIKKILEYKHLQNIDFLAIDENSKELKDIFELSKAIKKLYEELGKVSDTLLTKILLGTLGCVPAYDRFLKNSLKQHNMQQTFSKKGFLSVVDFYKENKSEFLAVHKSIGLRTYPTMKLVDMYFFKSGADSIITI